MPSASSCFCPTSRKPTTTPSETTYRKWRASNLFTGFGTTLNTMNTKLQRQKEKEETQYLRDLLKNKYGITKAEQEAEIEKTVKLLAGLWVSIRERKRPDETDSTFKARIRQLAQSEMNRYQALRASRSDGNQRQGSETEEEDVKVRLELSRQKLEKLFDALGGKGFGIDTLRAEFTGEHGYPLDRYSTRHKER